LVTWLIICDSHQESLKNILIIFAKLNAGIRYVQGMNEILAPLFFVFRDDPDYKNAVWSKQLLYCFVSFAVQQIVQKVNNFYSRVMTLRLYIMILLAGFPCRTSQKPILSFALWSYLAGLETTSARS
jgi:hypothetical protein